jgi:hypothetical protein
MPGADRVRGWSQEASEPVEHQGSRDGDVQAGTGADHRDLYGHIEQVDGLRRDAGLLVPQHGDSALPGRWQVGQPDCFLSELDPDDERTRRPLPR